MWQDDSEIAKRQAERWRRRTNQHIKEWAYNSFFKLVWCMLLVLRAQGFLPACVNACARARAGALRLASSNTTINSTSPASISLIASIFVWSNEAGGTWKALGILLTHEIFTSLLPLITLKHRAIGDEVLAYSCCCCLSACSEGSGCTQMCWPSPHIFCCGEHISGIFSFIFFVFFVFFVFFSRSPRNPPYFL